MKNFAPKLLAALVLAGCLLVGFWDARHKALWNDEFYSQVSSIHNTSYGQQFSGAIPEGGNAPLFYFLQKSFLQLIHYQTPVPWLQGHWYNDPNSQIVLRINPVVMMSLSVSLVFYYFCRWESLGIGLYSLFVYCSSYMLWAYWAEARPYALLVFLTTLQAVIFLRMMDQSSRPQEHKWWWMLGITNILLSLTAILSLGEILAASVAWWIFNKREWKQCVVVTLLPILIILFYYMHAPKYHFYFGSLSPEQLIRDNIPRERFDLLFLFFIFLAIYFACRQKPIFTPGEQILKGIPFTVFMSLVLISTAAILGLFAWHATPGKGFPITSRYFIYLTPIGVIATTILTAVLVKSLSQYRLLQWGLIGLLAFLFIQHFLKIVPKAIHSIMGG